MQERSEGNVKASKDIFVARKYTFKIGAFQFL